MSNFFSSTQFHQWIHTREALAELRETANQKPDCTANDDPEAGLDDASPLFSPNFKKSVPGLDGSTPTSNKRSQMEAPQRLTVQEEELLRRYWETRIPLVCGNFSGLTPHIRASALAYFKRFFLTQSMMEYDPIIVMGSTIYLAMKVEEKYDLALGKFAKEIEVDPADIVQTELALLEALKFQLITFHPYRSMRAFLKDLLKRVPGCVRISNLERDCKKMVEQSLISDNCLLFPPAQIAFAILWKVTSDAGVNIRQYAEERFEDPDALGSVWTAIPEILKEIESVDASFDKDVMETISEKATAYREVMTAQQKSKRARQKRMKDGKKYQKQVAAREKEEAEMKIFTGQNLIESSDPADEADTFVIRRKKKGKQITEDSD